jgi:hypothetical protein
MQASQRGIQVAVVGWAGVIAFAALMAFFGDVLPALVVAVVAVALILWLWRRPGRLALWVSLVLGGLFALQHAAYSVADLSDGGVLAFAGDVFGLAAGIAIVGGSVVALVQRRRACVAC